MIIGGQAVLLYGEPRLTRDIDVILGVNIDRLDTLLAVARQLSLKPLPKDIVTFVRQTMVLPVLGRGDRYSDGFYLFFHALRISGQRLFLSVRPYLNILMTSKTSISLKSDS
jgi:hypothetical protein